MSTLSPRTMLLIDADNVSADVIQQAIELVMARHGAIHVRRAYCTAETAVKHQKLFKRLSIRPVVNLSTGKNSTDIALAVDAIDLATTERPDVVVIASSDSDFAPLVLRLREKGCFVAGIGQEGKTGEEAPQAYDAFVDLPHRKAKAATRAAAKAPAAKKTSRRKAAAAVEAPAPAPISPPPPPPPPPPKPAMSEDARRILAALPELLRGEKVELRVAAERLRDAGLIGKSASSTKFFAKFPQLFALLPDKQPNKVQYRPLAGG